MAARFQEIGDLIEISPDDFHDDVSVTPPTGPAPVGGFFVVEASFEGAREQEKIPDNRKYPQVCPSLTR